ncbi:hypothetical protein EW145_g1301 [Phellinidium pouzarii]|uniref:Nucleoside diphosphate kinase n=1 Tax=Phellinidium pouzarii TaxID=167371 RepID=A0A4S4LFN5_9AGAM|nr:hypothetical protein EW145_g1301 [Phellinidium pouzarii]
MSGTRTPTTPTSDQDTRTRITRTVGIIKNHALKHRMTIERRIEEASFEIVKERQMEFDENSDREFLHELFGNDTASLFEGPVWVYVLERRRAIEVWTALVGEEDPDRARQTSPNSLRAIYGIDLSHNAVICSPNVDIAEEQISCLFQSSPPFLPLEPDELDALNNIDHELNENLTLEDWQGRESVLSPSSSRPSQSEQLTSSGSRKGTSVTSNGSYHRSGSASTPSGMAPFKARPVPKTTLIPDIAPRTTRSAALRAGILVSPNSSERKHTPRTKEEQKQTFMDVPGHKRSSIIQVASTAPPVIAPRMTRAASLRLGQKVAPSPSRPRGRPSSSDGTMSTFEGVPGHKRRETITVASVQAPAVMPRLNKSSELRAKRDLAPPTSFMFRQPSTPKIPGGLSRNPSQSSLSPSNSPSRVSSSMARPKSSMSRPRMATFGDTAPTGRLSSMGRSMSHPIFPSSSSKNENLTPTGPRLISPRPPSIEPRSNRSALLRAKAGNGAPTTPIKNAPALRRSSVTA